MNLAFGPWKVEEFRPIPINMARIVLVDDNQLSLKRCESLLQPLGYEVLSFTGAEEALQTMAIHPVNLVLVDLAMPIHSGYDLMKAMADKKINAKIVVVSGKNKDEDVKKALSMGAQDYIMKPYDDDFFIAKVNLALQHGTGAKVASFAEALSDVPSHLSLPVPTVSVSEIGFSFETPFPLPRGMKLDFKSAALTEMNLSSRPFRVSTSTLLERSGGDTAYRNFVSFVGLNSQQLTEVRLWVRSQQIKTRKA